MKGHIIVRSVVCKTEIIRVHRDGCARASNNYVEQLRSIKKQISGTQMWTSDAKHVMSAMIGCVRKSGGFLTVCVCTCVALVLVLVFATDTCILWHVSLENQHVKMWPNCQGIRHYAMFVERRQLAPLCATSCPACANLRGTFLRRLSLENENANRVWT